MTLTESEAFCFAGENLKPRGARSNTKGNRLTEVLREPFVPFVVNAFAPHLLPLHPNDGVDLFRLTWPMRVEEQVHAGPVRTP